MTMRVGRIPYINCYPVYGAVDRGIVALDAELVDGIPSALNRRMAQGALGVVAARRVRRSQRLFDERQPPRMGASENQEQNGKRRRGAPPQATPDGSGVDRARASSHDGNLLPLSPARIVAGNDPPYVSIRP